ncbi:MAG: hypothetical protein B5M56_09235 [Desulfococcus sp. 4484_241]|nr:MAG: hypothetical protein B5M56_09235 [Desulfococcus sp. 4484_241]
MFDTHITDIIQFIRERESEGGVSILDANAHRSWPVDERGALVLSGDTAVELGSPKTESTSFLVWSDAPGKVTNGRITLIGPDTIDETRRLVPFGKAVMVEVSGFDETNSHKRWLEMELAKYDVKLSGYMMRAVSQYQREWSRVSKKAKEDGFSLAILGGALIEKLMAFPYVHAAEVVFVTSSVQDVAALKAIGDKVAQITGAMNKMVEKIDVDCDTCEYSAVCNTVSELKKMRAAIKKAK